MDTRQPDTRIGTPPRLSALARVGLWALLLVSLCLRSGIPAGYMPAQTDPVTRVLALSLCVADGGLTALPFADPSSGHAPTGHHAAAQDCAFGLLAHQALGDGQPLLAVAAAAPGVTAVRQSRLSDASAVPDPHGPPLGARAPPSLLAPAA